VRCHRPRQVRCHRPRRVGHCCTTPLNPVRRQQYPTPSRPLSSLPRRQTTIMICTKTNNIGFEILVQFNFPDFFLTFSF
jgi:hypothetical protein